MKKETLKELINLKNGNITVWTKDTDIELSEIFSKLISFNILRKDKYTIRVNDVKALSKIIDFESIDKYLEWFENKDDNLNVNLNIENFIGRDNLGIQSSNSDLNNPTIQNIKKNIEPNKPTKSKLEIIYWIFGILVAITILYTFIIKVL
jgi:hypothetical protein